MKCSNRISNMQESPIRKLVPYSLKAKANGKTLGNQTFKLQKVISTQ